ncbi:MAG: alpha/beta hydrolase [Marinobacter sp.]|nr:alpha/beta hydrolase [Marinobacter sp.]
MRKVFQALGLLLVAGLAAVLAVGWAPDRPVETLIDRWAPAPSVFISIDGMQVHVRDEGPRDDRRPLVLVHGTSASLHTWDGWVAALAGQRRVIRFDLPGFGLTGPAPDNDYTIERYADFTVRVMNALAVSRAVVAGNSLGGQVALETALRSPERVAGLILVDSAGYPFTPESMPIGFRLAQVPALKPLMSSLLPRSMIESSVRNVYGNPEQVTEALIDRYYELTLREGNRAALVERFRQIGPVDNARERAASLTMPTLILWGDRDALIPVSVGEQMHDDIPGSELVRFEALGHVPHEEDPAETVAAVIAFLARHGL